MKLNYVFMAAIAILFSSCELLDPDYLANKEKEKEYKAAWEDKIGSIDKNQRWNSAVRTSFNVSVDEPSTISIYTLGQENRVLLGTSQVSSASVVSFDIPQGIGEMVAVYKESASGKSYKAVSVEELSTNQVSLAFEADRTLGIETKAAISDGSKKALTGVTDIDPRTGKHAKIWGYEEFPGWIWNDINEAMPEDKTVKGQVTDFELQSNGVFYISPIYGVTGNTEVSLGYYYYDPASPSDLTYVPLMDALKYDYLYDGLAYPDSDTALPKLLWKNKDTGEWLPCNFDFYDQPGKNSRNANRRGDDQYNVLSVMDSFGSSNVDESKIEAVKGLVYQIDAPKGNMVGFYVERPAVGYMNHTTASMNKKGYYNAIIKIYDGFRFIGLEDSDCVAESKRDCNDITFVMVPGNDGVLPGVLLPYVKDITKNMYYNADNTWSAEPKYDAATHGSSSSNSYEDLATKKQTWTLAFEDMGTIGDFDFNDVIIRITPDTRTKKADVSICATGGSYEAQIYYKKTLLGEAHELLGSTGLANTKSIKFEQKTIATVDWPATNSVEQNARDIYIVVKGEEITLPKTGGVPKAICVAGEWEWPKETLSISEAYPEFGDWGANYSDDTHWAWYTKPTDGKTIGLK